MDQRLNSPLFKHRDVLLRWIRRRWLSFPVFKQSLLFVVFGMGLAMQGVQDGSRIDCFGHMGLKLRGIRESQNCKNLMFCVVMLTTRTRTAVAC